MSTFEAADPDRRSGRWFENTPWWLVSMGIHAVVLLSAALISPANASRFARLGLKHRIPSISRTAQTAMSWLPACQPDPRMPTTLASLRARYLAPSPLAAPTRMRCMTPSGRIASGSPFAVENKSTSPT